MKKENGYWIDEKENKWDIELFSKEQAQKNSDFLTQHSCINCVNCRNCSYCSRYQTNPQRFISKNLGSRNSQTTIYWTNKEDIQIICGCFKGNLTEFEHKVNETHKNNPIYLQQYTQLINTIKYLINQ